MEQGRVWENEYFEFNLEKAPTYVELNLLTSNLKKFPIVESYRNIDFSIIRLFETPQPNDPYRFTLKNSPNDLDLPDEVINGTHFQMKLPLTVSRIGPINDENYPFKDNPILFTNGKMNANIDIAQLLNILCVNDDVMITFTDFSYLDAFYAMVTNSQLNTYKNFIVFAIDDQAFDELRSRGFVVYRFKSQIAESKDFEKASEFASVAFNLKMLVKMEIIRLCIQHRKHVLYFDTDLVIFKNPFSSLHECVFPDCIFTAQADLEPCAGFIYFLPEALPLINDIIEMVERTGIADQMALDHYVNSHRFAKYRNYKLLSKSVFMNGLNFFNTFPLFSERILKKSENITMFHNNFVIGYSNKVYRQREVLLFGIDNHAYYSNTTAKYIQIIESRSPQGDLRMMSELANRTNRIIVFPQYLCYYVAPCNLCNINHFNCLRDEIDALSFPWRESSFFLNKLVPLPIRYEGFTNIIYSLKNDEPSPRYVSLKKQKIRFGQESMIEKLANYINSLSDVRVFRIHQLSH